MYTLFLFKNKANMKLLDMLVKLQKDIFELHDDQTREVVTEVKAYHETLTNDSKSKIDKLYIKLHKGPWFRVMSVFLYVFIRKEFNKILHPNTDEFEEERLDRYNKIR